MALDPPMTAAELKATIGSITTEVMCADDLDPGTKKILVAALEHMHPWLERRRYRREMN
jgi:hypothetical protein